MPPVEQEKYLLDYATSKASDGLSKIGETTQEHIENSDDDDAKTEDPKNKYTAYLNPPIISETMKELENSEIYDVESEEDKENDGQEDNEVKSQEESKEQKDIKNMDLTAPNNNTEKQKLLLQDMKSANKSERFDSPKHIKVDLTKGNDPVVTISGPDDE
jgi:hypothetical protein